MIKQLMNKLGVEYGQKFSIGGMNTYEFTKDGLKCNDGGYNDLILREMVYGKITKKNHGNQNVEKHIILYLS